jgi:hydroxypyruvate isomerase
MAFELVVGTELLFREFGDPMSAGQLAAIRDAGFGLVEFWTWRDKDLDGIRRGLGNTGLRAVSMISEPRSRPVAPSRHGEFLDAVRDSIPVAQHLGIPNLVLTAGDRLPDVPAAEQQDALVRALRAAAPYAEDAGVTLLLENLNSRVDHVGTYLDHTTDALAAVRDVASPNVRVLYDLYHSVVMEERPGDLLRGSADLVTHLQIADHPGRHEPGSGTVDWPGHLRAVLETGYSGTLGLEYSPSTGDSLAAAGRTRDLVTRLDSASPTSTAAS